MYRGFSNPFTHEVYRLVLLRESNEPFQNLIKKCQAVPKEDRLETYAKDLEQLIRNEFYSKVHFVTSIFSYLWVSNTSHSFDFVNWEEVATEYLKQKSLL